MGIQQTAWLYLASLTHVAIQFVDIMGTLQEEGDDLKEPHRFWLAFMHQSFSYLTGVSCAGLRDVTVVDSIPAGHSSQLVLLQSTSEEEKKHEAAKK